MTDRHAYALTHPLNTAQGGPEAVAPYRRTDRQPDGNLLLTVLAVDR